jgi:hypothetical protein
MSDNKVSFANLAQLNFGEKLVEEVFKILALKENVPFYSFTDSKNWKKVIDQQPLTGYQFITDAQLKAKFGTEDAFSPNGMSRVDVLAYKDKGIPVEVKLGITGGACSFPSTFLGKWKDGDFLKAKSLKGSKNKRSFSGNMIHILDSSRKLEEHEELAVFSATFNETMHVLLEDEWWLVIRRDSLSGEHTQATSKDDPSFKKLSKVFIFEDLWDLINTTERKLIISYLTEIMVKQINTLPEYIEGKE